MTYVAGLAALARKGVIVKGGQHLESLGRVGKIAFDKTGTLSEGSFKMLDFRVIGDKRKRKEVLEYLALMEEPASHPLSDALVKGAANEQVSVPRHLQLKNHTMVAGEGITATVDDQLVHVGNKKMFKRLGLYRQLLEKDVAMVDEWAASGGTTGFVAIEGDGIVGCYCVADKIRDEAKSAVRGLKEMGIAITMLTGDQRPAAMKIGRQIGLVESDVRSSLLPDEKLTAIEGMVEIASGQQRCFSAHQTVMMCGDGVNDAPALALADVSVAMGEGAALAMETSDVTLLDSNLEKLVLAIRMGKRVVRTILENVTFSLLVKALVLWYTLDGRASLWAAIGSDVGAMLVVTLNGMKLLPRSNQKINVTDRQGV